MKNLTKKIIAIALLASPIAVLAAPAQAITTITDVNQVMRIITNVIDWIAGIFLAVSIFFVLYAGWLYLNSAGSEDKVKDAKNQLIYSAVGIAVALIAYSLPTLIENFIRTSA